MIKRVSLCLLAYAVLVAPSFAQALMDYKRFYPQSDFSVTKSEDLVYAKAITNYYLYNGSGSKSDRSNYDLVSRLPLTLDLFEPDTSSKPGKRAVLILIPGGGRSGCLGVTRCNQETLKQSGLHTSSAFYISQEGTNYNEITDTVANNYAKSGFLVLTLNTRYNYHDKRYATGPGQRWFKDGKPILNANSGYFENLVVDVKRAVRWISHPSRASAYNIDPNNIFVQGGSGGGKMASLAATVPLNTFIADSPAHTQSGNSQYQYEVDNNNLLVPQKPFRGTILFAGNMNGTSHRKLITAESGAFMFWHGTKDHTILHGLTETMEDKCEEVGCETEFYSLLNAGHGEAGGAKYEHTDRETNSAGLKTGVRAHIHDFIVNYLDKGTTDNRPTLSINSSKVKFSESSGRADIEINLSRAVGYDVKVTAAADQMREVMNGNGLTGRYSYLQDHLANDSTTTGPLVYAQGSGVAFESKSNVTSKYRDQTYHTDGPGEGHPVVIPSASDYFTDDFNGKRQVITIPAGQTRATFRVTLLNDTNYENNECFKVRLVNANGARITNSVESITILDDDNPSAGTATPNVCRNTSGGGGGGTPTDTVAPAIQINAPTLTSTATITDTTIVVTDDEAVEANAVTIRSDTTVGVSNFNCNQTNSRRVDCTIRINSSGILRLKATDEAGNAGYKSKDGYQITAPVADDEAPLVAITAPTLTAATTITDTTIVATDNLAIVANKVTIRSDTTAGLSNFNCSQTNSKRVDCTVNVTSSGILRIQARDQADNLSVKSKGGYEISSVPNPSRKPRITVDAPTKVSSSTITDTTVTVTDNQGISRFGVTLRPYNAVAVENFNCVQTDTKRVDCTLDITGSGILKLKARDWEGNLSHINVEGYVIDQVQNQTPVVNNPGNQTDTLGANVSLLISATDADGDTLTYSQTGLPAGLSIDSATGEISGSVNSIGVSNVTVTASDGAQSDSQSFTWTIEQLPNVAPTANAGARQTIMLPASATLQGEASDDGLPNPPGAITSTWRVLSGPGTATFADANALNTTASFSVAGDYFLQLQVSDGELTAKSNIRITVESILNLAPTVNAGTDQTIMLPANVTLQGEATDDGLPNPPGAISSTWAKISGPGTVAFTDVNAHSTAASFSVEGDYVLQLSVSDGALTVTDEVAITVESVLNLAPTTNAGADQTIMLPANATLQGTATDDGLPNPPGAVTSSWSRVSGPGTVTFADVDALNTTASFSTDGDYVLQLSVSDGALTVTDDVAITVESVLNLAPTANAGSDQTIMLPSNATLIGSASDDGLPNPPGAVTSSWSKLSGPGTVTFADVNALNTTASFSNDGDYVLQLSVTDGALTTTDEVDITVESILNLAPTANAGADQTITLPADATLQGSASDDGLPNPPGTVTSSWSKLSGPGTVTFTNANALNTTASFSVDGDYILQLSVTDGALTTTDDIEITVNPEPIACIDIDFDDGFNGWANLGSSTCSTGTFVNGTPNRIVDGGVVTQVGGDHTSGSGRALYTAYNTGIGVNDVDSGECSMQSPTYPITVASSMSIWYFHGQRDTGNDSNGDYFRLEYTLNNGASWTQMASNGDQRHDAQWTQALANIPGNVNVRLRVVASDGTRTGDLIEAGVDDLKICPL